MVYTVPRPNNLVNVLYGLLRHVRIIGPEYQVLKGPAKTLVRKVGGFAWRKLVNHGKTN